MLLAVLPLVLAFLPVRAEEPVRAKVIAVYPDRNTTKLVIESSHPLVAGRNVYVGADHAEVTLGDLLSRSEDLYYYSASAPGKVQVEKGDPVSLAPPRTLRAPEAGLRLMIRERYEFRQKKHGGITAVQGNRAMIDRGTLHEVHERDLYRVHDSSGRYKGLLEVRGIGDLQSSGELYNALEDRRRDALRAAPGDYVVFSGQRKLFALGLVGGLRSGAERAIDTDESTYAAGLLWNVTFRDGWGAEVLFGGYFREGKGSYAYKTTVPFYMYTVSNARKASFLGPISLKKNLFYPSVVSPFLSAGVSLFVGKNEFSRYELPTSTEELTKEETKVTTLVPALGGGIEFFPARFFRPRIEVRWFDGPKITANGNTFYTESVFASIGFLTTW